MIDAQNPILTPIEPTKFRDVLGHFCSGITVIAALREEMPVGLTCQSFFSLSLGPPLVAFSVSKTSTSYPAIRAAGDLVINVLSSEQMAVSDGFARTGTNKWQGVSWRPGPVTKYPILDGALAALECSIDKEVDAGDHILVIARVHHLEADTQSMPLLYFRGDYRRLHNVDNLHNDCIPVTSQPETDITLQID